MEEETITVKVLSTTLDSLEKFHELQKWALAEEGIGCGVFVTPAGDLRAQLDGTTVPTAIARLGDTVRWDGFKFYVEQASERFDRGGLAADGLALQPSEPEQVLSPEQTRDDGDSAGTASP